MLGARRGCSILMSLILRRELLKDIVREFSLPLLVKNAVAGSDQLGEDPCATFDKEAYEEDHDAYEVDHGVDLVKAALIGSKQLIEACEEFHVLSSPFNLGQVLVFVSEDFRV